MKTIKEGRLQFKIDSGHWNVIELDKTNTYLKFLEPNFKYSSPNTKHNLIVGSFDILLESDKQILFVELKDYYGSSSSKPLAKGLHQDEEWIKLFPDNLVDKNRSGIHYANKGDLVYEMGKKTIGSLLSLVASYRLGLNEIPPSAGSKLLEAGTSVKVLVLKYQEGLLAQKTEDVQGLIDNLQQRLAKLLLWMNATVIVCSPEEFAKHTPGVSFKFNA